MFNTHARVDFITVLKIFYAVVGILQNQCRSAAELADMLFAHIIDILSSDSIAVIILAGAKCNSLPS